MTGQHRVQKSPEFIGGGELLTRATSGRRAHACTHARDAHRRSAALRRCVALLAALWLLLLLLLLLLVGAAVGVGRCDEKKRGRETRAGRQAGQAGKAAGAGNRQTGWKSGDLQDPVGMVKVLYVLW